MKRIVVNTFAIILPIIIGFTLLAKLMDRQITNPMQYFLDGLKNIGDVANVWEDWITILQNVGEQITSLLNAEKNIWQTLVSGINVLINLITLPFQLLAAFCVKIGVLLYNTAIWIFMYTN